MKISLSFKILGILFILSCLLFVGLTYFSLTNSKENLISSFTERAKATAYSLEVNIASKEDLTNKDKLLSNIHKIMWLDSEIISVCFNLPQDNKMVTFISNDSNKIGQDSGSDNLNSYETNTLISRVNKNAGEERLEVITPMHIAGQQVGTVQIFFSLEGVNQRISTAIKNLVFGYIIMIILFLATIFLIVRIIIIKPISEINKGVEAILTNDFNYKIKIHSHDEFHRLADIFNNMTTELNASRQKTIAYTQELEKKVKERTTQIVMEKDVLESKVKERTSELEKLKDSLELTVKERTTTLQDKLKELEQMNKLMVGRELRMAELKKEIAELKK